MKEQVASLWVLRFNPRQFQPLVKKGEEVKRGQVLGIRRRRHARLINFAARLRVAPKKVSPYLLVASGTLVKKGTVLARRRRWFKKEIVVSAPRGGKFVWPSQRPGWGKIVWITKSNLRSPLAGRVINRQENSLSIRFVAEVFKVKTKFGGQLWGVLARAPDNFLELEQLPKNACLLVENPSLPLAHKAKVLGARALVSRQKLANSPLPIFVSDDYNALLPFVGQPVLADGRQQRLLVGAKNESKEKKA